ncbi:MAG TPA: hypothetical protein VG871_06180 [Vicinamibacterales bacterium]|nr:hypothetical protein [Vicinamibacterales bacterium]
MSHDVLVRGVAFGPSLSARPALIGMPDTDFPARFFGDFGRDAAARVSAAKTLTKSADGHFHLLQPVQRTVQVALVDLACDVVGEPRLSPQRVESAGLVIRRVRVDAKSRTPRHDQTLEAWMQSPDGKFGWVPMKKSDEDLDPDPTRRPALYSGQPELDRLLSESQRKTALTETFTPAFVTPPEVCERIDRTLLFGVVPTASRDVGDAPPVTIDYTSDDTLKTQLPPLLLSGSHRAPFPGKTVTPHYMSTEYCKQNGYADFLILANVLQVVAVELHAFDRSTAGDALVAALNRGTVTFADKSTMGVGDFLARANTRLLDSSGSSTALLLPVKWSDSSSDDEAAVLKAAGDCLRARASQVLAPSGRFQDHTRLYRLRLFLRVRGHDPSCPTETIWSEYSDPFEIAPWYETAGLVGPPVPMPAPSPSFFKSAKPNVSFVVPDTLMNASNGSLSDLLKGISPSNTPAISWICGFNIPIITICAFIVLSIFLSLLNIVFWWLPFVKICIPIPSGVLPEVGGES